MYSESTSRSAENWDTRLNQEVKENLDFKDELGEKIEELTLGNINRTE